MTLRVTVEIVPFGDEEEKRVIDVYNISNLGASQQDPVGRTPYRYGVEKNKYKTGEYDLFVGHYREDGYEELVREVFSYLSVLPK